MLTVALLQCGSIAFQERSKHSQMRQPASQKKGTSVKKHGCRETLAVNGDALTPNLSACLEWHYQDAVGLPSNEWGSYQCDKRVEQRPQQARLDGRAGRDDGDERRLEQLVPVE